jgi:hypothetical protein
VANVYLGAKLAGTAAFGSVITAYENPGLAKFAIWRKFDIKTTAGAATRNAGSTSLLSALLRPQPETDDPR